MSECLISYALARGIRVVSYLIVRKNFAYHACVQIPNVEKQFAVELNSLQSAEDDKQRLNVKYLSVELEYSE